MDVGAYLDRIGLRERPPATLAGLTTLHRAHLRAIPYENLDVQLGRPLTLAQAPMLEKVIGRRRGGWCYEMNGTLGWALAELGFDVRRATGAVTVTAEREGSRGNHLVLRVALPEGLYLADVGLSGGPLDPFRVTEGAFSSGGFNYRIERVDSDWWRFHNDPMSGPPAFDFNLDPADESLFATRCAELQVADWSPFVQNLITARFTERGKRVLLGRTLREVTPGGRDERLLGSADELVDVLRHGFGLDAPDAATLWPRICERHEAVLARNATAAAAS
jgi:N-hydroxyarylamine O-acetyltransferase